MPDEEEWKYFPIWSTKGVSQAEDKAAILRKKSYVESCITFEEKPECISLCYVSLVTMEP